MASRVCWTLARTRLLSRSPPRARRGVRRPRQVEQVRLLRLVQLQGPGQGVQHAFRDSAQVAALEPGVVVDAHPGEQRDLLAAEPGDPPVAPVRGQAGLVGADPGPPGGQERPDLLPVVSHPEPTGRPPRGRPCQYLGRRAGLVRKRTWPTGDNRAVTSSRWRPRRLP